MDSIFSDVLTGVQDFSNPMLDGVEGDRVASRRRIRTRSSLQQESVSTNFIIDPADIVEAMNAGEAIPFVTEEQSDLTSSSLFVDASRVASQLLELEGFFGGDEVIRTSSQLQSQVLQANQMISPELSSGFEIEFFVKA